MSQYNHRKMRIKVRFDYSTPTIVISRSNKNIMAQFVGQDKKTVFTVDSSKLSGTKISQADSVGKQVAEKLNALKIKKVIFNRNGFIYHGRVKALADAIRQNGITI
jgi:large subunit ribosomal protein L18